MATAIEIVSVTNNGDGTTADVVFSGTPTGTLSFKISRTPEYAYALDASSTVVGNTATVTVPNPDGWYFFAVDDNGESASAAQWIALGDGTTDIDLTGQFLQSTLDAHRPLINAALQRWWPQTTIKQIIYGSPIGMRDFPCILISKPRETQDWFAFPFVKDITYSFQISLVVVHSKPEIVLTMLTKVMGQLMAILNKPEYNQITLSSGTGLAFCQCSSADGDEEQIDDSNWACVATLLWSGRALKQYSGGPYAP